MKKLIKNILSIFRKCKSARSNFLIVYFKYLFYSIFYQKKILSHQKTSIKGVKNISTKKILNVGVKYVGFMLPSDRTFLNIQGKLILKGNYSIGRGCRFDIGKNATVSIGEGGYINANSKIIIMHDLTIGNNCAIAWDCQFLDEDFHTINYKNKITRPKKISIGNNVWIGAGVKIYEGTIIADGCVIASNSIVRGFFNKENTIIGGNPAKVIKENVSWD